MQTTSTLPIQVNGAGPANAPQRGGNGNAEPGQFSATLSREMDQRRQLPPTAAAQPPARPQQPQPGPKAQQPAKAQQTDKPAEKQAEKQAASAAEPERAAATDPAAGGETRTAQAGDGEDGAQQASAEASSPVADMLALVASFNQLLRAPVAQGEAPAAGTLQPGLPSASLETLTRNLLAEAAGGAAAGAANPDEAGALLPDPLAGKPLKVAIADAGARQAFAPAMEAAAQRAAAVQQAALPVQAETVAEAPLALQQAPQVQQAAAAAAPANTLPARVGTPAWDNQVGQKIVWMVAGGDQSAELTLNPPDLGPMQVVLNVSGDQASVTFTANQLEVRQALENALPRLREMMGESGITLGDASVNAGHDQRQAQDGQAGGGARFAGGTGENGSDDAAARPAGRTTLIGERGMVDTFA